MVSIALCVIVAILAVISVLVAKIAFRREPPAPVSPVPLCMHEAPRALPAEAPAVTSERAALPAPTSTGAHLEEVVRAAIAERLRHEQENPRRYPRDHRERAVHQMARRLLHIQSHTHDDDELERVIAAELRRLA